MEETERINVTLHLQTMLCMCDSIIRASLETAADEFEVSSYAAAQAFKIKDALEYTLFRRGEIPGIAEAEDEYEEYRKQYKDLLK